MAEKLRPCPFCGSDNVSIEAYTHWEAPPLYIGYVLCLNCGANGGTKDDLPSKRKARRWAVTLWNNRKENERG